MLDHVLNQHAAFVHSLVYCLAARVGSIYNLQQLRLQYELALLILLALLVRFVVLPTHSLIALLAYNVSDDMSAGCHVAFHGLGGLDIDDGGEEEGFTMLAAEVLGGKFVS